MGGSSRAAEWCKVKARQGGVSCILNKHRRAGGQVLPSVHCALDNPSECGMQWQKKWGAATTVAPLSLLSSHCAQKPGQAATIARPGCLQLCQPEKLHFLLHEEPKHCFSSGDS